MITVGGFGCGVGGTGWWVLALFLVVCFDCLFSGFFCCFLLVALWFVNSCFVCGFGGSGVCCFGGWVGFPEGCWFCVFHGSCLFMLWVCMLRVLWWLLRFVVVWLFCEWVG